ncbi:MAG: DUF4238 domain-containing protein [Ignavibacteria bacterium]
MVKYKRQHFIPKFYLDNFAINNKIWVFDRIKKEYRIQSIKDTAVIKDYYSLKNDSKNIYQIEEFLSKVESITKLVIDKLINGSTIDDSEKVSLSVFLALLFTRTPEYEKQTNELTSKAFKKFNEVLFPNIESVKARIAHIEKKGNKSLNISAEEFFNSIKDQQVTAKYDRTNMIYMMIHHATGFCYYFHKKEWFISKSLETSEFITSDNPIIKIPTSDQLRDKVRGYGIDTPGVKKVFPLNYCTSLCIADDGSCIGFGNLDSGNIETINKFIAINSDRYIFGRSKEMLHKIVGLTRIDEWVKEERVKVT